MFKFLISRPKIPGGDLAGVIENADEKSKVILLSLSMLIWGTFLLDPAFRCRGFAFIYSERIHVSKTSLILRTY